MPESTPSVSIIIPARDAAESLPRALAAIEAQDYPRIVEVIVAAADRPTASAAADRGAKVVLNPTGTTPAGLNAAITASTGEVVVRCDAQSVLPSGYVSRAVATLTRTGADNVGGMQVPVGEKLVTRAIAGAMSSRLGAGDARFRVGGKEGPVETVYLGAFRRAALDALGGFDDEFERNQDYELNHRIRERGGIVWFDPALRVEYTPRASLQGLAQQYFRYGRGKRRFSRAHPGSLRWRQLAPPLLVIGLALSLAASLFQPLFLLLPGAYLLTLLGGALIESRRAGWAALLMPIMWCVMHLSWGIGFIVGE